MGFLRVWVNTVLKLNHNIVALRCMAAQRTSKGGSLVALSPLSQERCRCTNCCKCRCRFCSACKCRCRLINSLKEQNCWLFHSCCPLLLLKWVLFGSFWHISADRQEEHWNIHLVSSISRDHEEELLNYWQPVPSVYPPNDANQDYRY